MYDVQMSQPKGSTYRDLRSIFVITKMLYFNIKYIIKIYYTIDESHSKEYIINYLNLIQILKVHSFLMYLIFIILIFNVSNTIYIFLFYN